MSERLLPANIVLATTSLALGYGSSGLWVWVLPVVVLGGIWLFGLRRHWDWISFVGFAFLTGGAAAGVLQNAGVGWMLFGMGTALAAWDLDGFVRRLQSTQQVEGRGDLERRHLLRLLAVELLGLLLAAAALGVALRLSFGVVLLLGVLAILGLSRVIGFLRRENS
jgi:hypothetical protein